jgi:hypothetical protein
MSDQSDPVHVMLVALALLVLAFGIATYFMLR